MERELLVFSRLRGDANLAQTFAEAVKSMFNTAWKDCNQKR